MKNHLKKLASNKIIKIAASLKLTVVCLVILAALVVWGTVYQTDHGLYQAQQKFFHSWFFLIFGFIPFPGTVLIMFILFFNLVFAIIFRIGFRFSNLGNIFTHMGIIILLVGGFFTFYFSEESSLVLKEGETSHMSDSRHLWELAVWEQKSGYKDIYAVDTKDFDPGDTVRIEDLNLELQIKEYYKNCAAFTGSSDSTMVKNKRINASGIQVLRPLPNATEVADNTAGIVFYINPNDDSQKTLLLYGQDSLPTPVTVNNRTLFFSLRKKKIVLPLSITLKDFKMRLYPNSTIPKSYESTVSIKAEGGIERDVVISMNKPLRFKDLTFFQSSYFIAKDGSEYTILAVVKNFGRLLPYYSSILIFLGLVIHFLVKLFKSKKNSGLIMSRGIYKRLLMKKMKNRQIKFWLIILTGMVIWGLSGSKLAFAEREGVSLKHLRKLAIMENGRIKPLDTFAQNMLKQFSGQSRFQKKPAIQWLVRVLFTPEHTYNDRIFLITNPEVLDSIGVVRVGKARDRYSFLQLKDGLPKLRQLAINASRINAKKRSFIENEIMALYNKLYIFQQLMASFQFLFPHPDFTVTDAETLKILDLPKNKNYFSFFDMFERKRKLLELKTSIENKNRTEWTTAETNLLDISKRMEAWSNFYQDLPLTIIPAAKKGETNEEKWLSPWDILSPFKDGTIRKELVLIRDFVQAYADNDPEQFDRAVKAFNRFILEQSEGRIRERAISLEVFYNQVDPFYRAKFFYGFSVLFLLLSFIMLKKWFYRLGFLLLAVGFLLHMFGTIARMNIMLRPPVTNLYETFIFTGLITVLLGMILEFSKKRNIGILTGGLSGLVMLMIASKYALEGDTMGMLVAVLDSNFWLASHVITIILGYAGIVLSGFIGHVYVLQRISRPEKKELLKNTFQAVYATQAFGIIFTFLGTVLGGIWADQSWGRFWGWDPKENGALLILLWSAILFHAKKANWIKEIGMAFGTIIGVIAVSLAWFGVNLLGVGLHSYGFTSGIAKTLFIFILFEVMFILFGILMLKSGKNHLKSKGNVKTFMK